MLSRQERPTGFDCAEQGKARIECESVDVDDAYDKNSPKTHAHEEIVASSD